MHRPACNVATFKNKALIQCRIYLVAGEWLQLQHALPPIPPSGAYLLLCSCANVIGARSV